MKAIVYICLGLMFFMLPQNLFASPLYSEKISGDLSQQANIVNSFNSENGGKWQYGSLGFPPETYDTYDREFGEHISFIMQPDPKENQSLTEAQAQISALEFLNKNFKYFGLKSLNEVNALSMRTGRIYEESSDEIVNGEYVMLKRYVVEFSGSLPTVGYENTQSLNRRYYLNVTVIETGGVIIVSNNTMNFPDNITVSTKSQLCAHDNLIKQVLLALEFKYYDLTLKDFAVTSLVEANEVKSYQPIIHVQKVSKTEIELTSAYEFTVNKTVQGISVQFLVVVNGQTGALMKTVMQIEDDSVLAEVLSYKLDYETWNGLVVGATPLRENVKLSAIGEMSFLGAVHKVYSVIAENGEGLSWAFYIDATTGKMLKVEKLFVF